MKARIGDFNNTNNIRQSVDSNTILSFYLIIELAVWTYVLNCICCRYLITHNTTSFAQHKDMIKMISLMARWLFLKK